MSLERMWAGWRAAYVETAIDDPTAALGAAETCVFCAILAAPAEADPAAGHGRQVLWRDGEAAVLLNAFPYTNGHLLVMPLRHVSELEDLAPTEASAVWGALAEAVRAIKAAYRPDGLNIGANLGRSAGAGIPGHFHVHALPRWSGDTNFMTSVAEARVLPETLVDTHAKLLAAWPPSPLA